MTHCAICGRSADETRDPRLPLLRIIACRSCRDRIAAAVGWTRATRRGGSRVWWRRGIRVEVAP